MYIYMPSQKYWNNAIIKCYISISSQNMKSMQLENDIYIYRSSQKSENPLL